MFAATVQASLPIRLVSQLVRTVADQFQCARSFEAQGMAPGTYVCRLEVGARSFQRTLEVVC